MASGCTGLLGIVLEGTGTRYTHFWAASGRMTRRGWGENSQAADPEGSKWHRGAHGSSWEGPGKLNWGGCAAESLGKPHSIRTSLPLARLSFPNWHVPGGMDMTTCLPGPESNLGCHSSGNFHLICLFALETGLLPA